MIYLSQRDPAWAAEKIGTSNLTVGRYGCTTTCISMISAQFGFYLSPAAIAKRPNCYTKEGLILWGNLSIPHCAFLKRIRSFNPAAIKASLDNQNERVMLEVNYGQHWVLADRKMWFRNDYVCIDPWTGKPCAAIGDYHNITGSAHFRKT